MSGQTQRSGGSLVFTGEATHSGGSGEMDEVARSWPQLMALLGQLMRHIHARTADGSIKLSRRQWQQLATEARDIQALHEHHADISRHWYDERIREYQREAVAASSRVDGSSAEERAQDAQYLRGLRAGIEHTIHTTPLTDVERGQVVNVLNRIDVDPGEPLPRTAFGALDRPAAAQARRSAAASEHSWLEHRDQLDLTGKTAGRERPAVRESASPREFSRDAAERFSDLAARIERLEQQINALTVSETATAAASSNGHATPRPAAKQARTTQVQTAEHEAAEHDPAEGSAPRARSHTAHADAAEQNGHATEQAHASPSGTAEHAQAMTDEQVAEYIAEMEAEA